MNRKLPSLHHQPRQRFGQNFLHDERVIQQIIGAIHPQPQDHLVEIGPGLGALTKPLLAAAGKLEAIEIDRDLIPKLRLLCLDEGELKIHQADALRFDFSSLVAQSERLRIVGNLPYNISTPLLFHLLEQIDVIDDLHFMLQKEVVERMAASPGTRDYGRLSVMMQYHCAVELLFIVSPEAFSPAPQVESAVVRLVPHRQLPYPCHSLSQLKQVLQHAFNQRRKTLRNSLKPLFTAEALVSLGIDPTQRAEQLTLEQYVMLSNSLL